MKYVIIKNCILVSILFFLPTLALAQFTGEKSDPSTTTVEEFKNQVDIGSSEGLLDLALTVEKADDKNYVFKGNITKKVEDDIYQFKDKTGTINVKIKDFDGIVVGPKDKVYLYGEADYDDGELIFEVDKIKLVE